MKLITKRIITAQAVRSLCIKQNYYTHGTTEEFGDMLDFVDGVELDDESLILEIASDIFNHSDIDAWMYEYGCDKTELLESICYNLINDCTYTTVKIEK